MSQRVLTISGLYQSSSSYKPVPAIRIQGKWLEKLGFTIRSKVKVCEGTEEINIKLVKEDSHACENIQGLPFRRKKQSSTTADAGKMARKAGLYGR